MSTIKFETDLKGGLVLAIPPEIVPSPTLALISTNTKAPQK
jgi:hypothetical protein